MTGRKLWTLPVPSTALLDGDPVFGKRLGREVAIRFAYESEDDSRRDQALVFQGVEAFKCTYYRARDETMREAYDQLIDRGRTSWLDEIVASLKKNRGDALGLVHFMINFDDGLAYEVVGRSFRIEDVVGESPSV